MHANKHTLPFQVLPHQHAYLDLSSPRQRSPWEHYDSTHMPMRKRRAAQVPSYVPPGIPVFVPTNIDSSHGIPGYFPRHHIPPFASNPSGHHYGSNQIPHHPFVPPHHPNRPHHPYPPPHHPNRPPHHPNRPPHRPHPPPHHPNRPPHRPHPPPHHRPSTTTEGSIPTPTTTEMHPTWPTTLPTTTTERVTVPMYEYDYYFDDDDDSTSVSQVFPVTEPSFPAWTTHRVPPMYNPDAEIIPPLVRNHF